MALVKVAHTSISYAFSWVYMLGLVIGLSSAPLADAQAAPPLSTTSTTLTAASTVASTPHISAISHPQEVQTAQNNVNQIIFGERYSHAIPQTRWEETEPNKKPNAWQTFWENLIKHFKPTSTDNASTMNGGAILGAMIKTVALLTLLAAIVWLIIQRQKWLPWLQSRRFGRHSKQAARVTAFEQRLLPPLWQHLPAKMQLAHAVQQALDSQNWQLALSLLYRGTLREVVALYDLPITQASTEQQCTWLLEQANYRRVLNTADSAKNLNEAEFFTQLVALWSQIAYGNTADFDKLNRQFASNEPNLRQTIERLLSLWQQLYLQPIQPSLVATARNPSNPTTPSTLGAI